VTVVIAKPKLILYGSQSIIKVLVGYTDITEGLVRANIQRGDRARERSHTTSPPDRKILVIETGSEITDTAKACYNGTLGTGIWYRYREITLI
jgi:hypothetical protein